VLHPNLMDRHPRLVHYSFVSCLSICGSFNYGSSWARASRGVEGYQKGKVTGAARSEVRPEPPRSPIILCFPQVFSTKQSPKPHLISTYIQITAAESLLPVKANNLGFRRTRPQVTQFEMGSDWMRLPTCIPEIGDRSTG
jgi:hypothetical protein